MDIITRLKDEHAAHRKLFARMRDTAPRAEVTRARLLAELARELRVHMRFEEDTLFPAIKPKADKETRAQTLECYAEHEAARATLHELENTPLKDEMWEAWLKVLAEELEHHMEEEEDDLFPQARKLIDRSRLEAMNAEYDALRERAAEAPQRHHTTLIGLH